MVEFDSGFAWSTGAPGYRPTDFDKKKREAFLMYGVIPSFAIGRRQTRFDPNRNQVGPQRSKAP